MSENKKYIDGNRIKAERCRQNFSQEELAEICGYSTRTIQRAEGRINKELGSREEKIASALNVPIDNFYIKRKVNSDGIFVLDPNHFVQVLIHCDKIAIDIDPFIRNDEWNEQATNIMKSLSYLIKNDLFLENPKHINKSFHRFDELMDYADNKSIIFKMYTERVNTQDLINVSDKNNTIGLCSILLTHPDQDQKLLKNSNNLKIKPWYAYFETLFPQDYVFNKTKMLREGFERKSNAEINILSLNEIKWNS